MRIEVGFDIGAWGCGGVGPGKSLGCGYAGVVEVGDM